MLVNMVYNITMSNNSRGVALLDSIIAVSIFVVLFIGFFVLIQLGIRTVTEHRARVGALAIASSKIEYIRSLEYSSIGVQGGNPNGNIAATSYESLNALQYTININISWVDDPADGVAGSGDTDPNDYKAIRVEVSWPEQGGGTDAVVLSSYVSDFIPE
jgi:hypothetical protein